MSKKRPLKPKMNESDDDSVSCSDDEIPTKPAKAQKTIEEKMEQREHILARPDSYIGAVEANTVPTWVYENDRLVFRPVTYVPGLYKIFDEIIVNAADNKIRDKRMDTIKVTIDRENNFISVYNNGRGIPIEIHKEEKVYVPELIFGHLLTSSNYNDSEKKVTGGRNGYGAKLCNIFSTEFVVETADATKKRKYKQIFTKNMTKIGTPIITDSSKGDEYTRISFKPDLAKFGMTCIDNDLEALLTKRVYDLAGCVSGVKVYLNDNRVKVKNFKDYIEMYIAAMSQSTGEGAVSRPNVVYERFSDRWEIAVTSSEGQFQQVSFVNSICTMKGGTHVNYITDQVVTSLIEVVKKKEKKNANIKPFQVKNHLWVFINCLIENPAFDSQTKENMTLRQSAFGSKCQLSEDFIKKVLKSGVVESILDDVRIRQEKAMKKQDGRKTTRISGIAKLDDANNAGTRNASKCTLILTEGDSAKSLAVGGLSVVGRDNYGVFPLRGKLLNVREATHSQIMANSEITAIKQILGLQHGKTYTSTDSLRYGHLMIMTDQDHDGSHIKGLIINFLDHFWPSLLKIPNFLLEFITPIVKCTKDKQEISFFTLPEYEEWKKHNDHKNWKCKYYKGLGTSTAVDGKKYFSNMDKHCKPFKKCSEDERQLIDMAFNKKKADDRKEWLRQCKPGTFMDHSIKEIPISDFVNRELILFSMADNARSIPCVVDGLKPGQRKIMFGCFKRKLKDEVKVAQLAGYISEHTAYHHGEQSLCATIVGLAQNFIGSNNLNLLEPRGQFGTRLQGGKDAASPRYIFTTLSKLARHIYNPSDDSILEYLNEDGQDIEPQWYMPILPMVLVNGSEGIGTGWSTSIPNYNPQDIVNNIRRLINGEELEKMHPWYRGFKGAIESVNSEKYKVSGIMEKIDDNTIRVVELPIRTWTQNYKEMLEEWLTGTEKSPSCIQDYKEYHTDAHVEFVITMSDEQMKKAEAEGLEKKFKMTTTITTSNMVCFDQEGRIKKYENVESILSDFYQLRLKYYQMRKEYLLDQLTLEWTKCDNKVRFVTEIIEGKLIVQNRKKTEIFQDLKKRGYAPIFSKKGKVSTEEEDDDSENESAGGYDYLLSMAIWSLTWEKVQQLKKERDAKSEEVKYLSSQTAKDLWNIDLDQFSIQWEAFLEEMDKLENEGVVGNRGKNAAKSKKQKFLKIGSDVEVSDGDFSIKKQTKAVKPKEEKEEKAKKPPAKPRAPKAVKQETQNVKVEVQEKPKESYEDVMAAKKATLLSKLAKFQSGNDDGDDDDAFEEQKAVPKKAQSKLTDYISTKPEPKPAAKKKQVTKKKKESDDEHSEPDEWEFTEKKIPKARKQASVSSKSSSAKSTPAISAANSDEDIVEVTKPVAKRKIVKKAPVVETSEGESDESPSTKANSSRESSLEIEEVPKKNVSKSAAPRSRKIASYQVDSESAHDSESEADFDDEDSDDY